MQHVKAGKLTADRGVERKRSPLAAGHAHVHRERRPRFRGRARGWASSRPAKTPRPVIDKLNRELNAVLATPEIIEQLATLGIVATPGTPEQFGEQMKTDLAEYGAVVKAAGIKAE